MKARLLALILLTLPLFAMADEPTFAPGTEISYDVDATAAMVDSVLPNTVGAKPSIAIQGQYVRAAIR